MSNLDSAPPPVVKLEHVSFKYGKTLALDDFSLEIAPRKLVGLIGPDGVGKSTMLSLITGARAMQDSGDITVLGGDMRSKEHRNRVCPKIAYMPQGLGKNLYRLAEVQDIVDAIEKDAEKMCSAEQLHREGKLPKRICHCDTKVSNMMFDMEGKVLCVIDLDTIMPSFIFSDFGDFLRSAANTGKEDDTDLNNVQFNMEIFKAFAKGYIESAKVFLTPLEIEMLPYAAQLFPYMQAVRFLADYINGDTYYQTKYAEHNLVRTKAQYKLYQEACNCEPVMKDFIAGLIG